MANTVGDGVEVNNGAGDEFVGSHMKADNKYGQNGYTGASSDLPGEHTTSGFLPMVTLPADDWQVRKVAPEAYPTAFGMKSPAAPVKVFETNVHRASKQAAPGSFQR